MSIRRLLGGDTQGTLNLEVRLFGPAKTCKRLAQPSIPIDRAGKTEFIDINICVRDPDKVYVTLHIPLTGEFNFAYFHFFKSVIGMKFIIISND